MKNKKNVLFKFFDLVKGQKIWLGLGVFGAFSTAISLVVTFSFWRVLLDSAVERNFDDFYSIIPISIIMIFVIVFTEMLATYCLGKYSELSTKKLRNKIVEKINKLPISYLDKQHSGDILSKMTNDVNQIREYFFSHFANWVFIPLMAIIALSYMLWTSWSLTLFTVVLIPVFGIITSKVSDKMKKYSKNVHDKLGEANSIIQDSINGFEVNKAFNLENIHEKEHNEIVDITIENGKKIANKKGVLNSLIIVFNLMPFLMCVLYGGYLVSNGFITVGQMLIFVQLLNFLTNPMQELPVLLGETKSTSASLDRINDLLNLDEEKESGKVFNINEQIAIEFENIDFSYDETKVLNNMSFKIKKGEKIALVGPSGGGKSTILRLIAGYYEKQKGVLKYFGHKKEDWNLKTLRENMSIVTQDTYLYPLSIKENIKYGKLNANENEIIQASIAANAHEFIQKLPEGYNTKVGEYGNRLSGGQKQRIAIARAFIKNAEILLFDEPTSALDTEAEKLVQRALERISEGKTTITVAHRLSTIKNADRILVIDKGKVVEEGSHEFLLKSRKTYFNLYKKLFEREQEEKIIMAGEAS